MRVATTCPVCIDAALARGAPPEEIAQLHARRVSAFITHERAAEATCSSGHEFSLRIADPAYALVFERGLQRLAEGDMRDAVLDAYTALEMYVPTVLVRARYDLDASVAPQDIPRLREEFKMFRSDASRALGAALAVASVVSGRPPPDFKTKLSKVRNDAVHAGIYPEPEQAKWAVCEVARIVWALEDLLDAAAPNRSPSFRLAQSIVDFPAHNANLPGTTLIFSSVLSGLISPRETVEERLARYECGELALLRLF